MLEETVCGAGWALGAARLAGRPFGTAPRPCRWCPHVSPEGPTWHPGLMYAGQGAGEARGPAGPSCPAGPGELLGRALWWPG